MESFDQVFDIVCNYCKQKMSDIAYTLWIKEIKPIKMEGSTVYLMVRSKFKKDVIEEKYLTLLTKAFYDVLGFDITIDIDFEITQPLDPLQEQNKESKYSFGEYEYTFDTFIVGSANKFAHAAAFAVASNPSNAYNPLFIYGNSGLGKTHLLTAICNEINKNTPDQNIIFVKGEEFTNELIDAIKIKNTSDFHTKYRRADILLVDDIQFIGGKDSTQEEFFHTFNALYQEGKQIILTSDRPPKEIKTLEDRLRTRFEWGLMADIQAPDFETRTAIIRRKAELLDFKIPTEVAEYIANKLKSNIRQLEGAVKKLKAYEQLNNSPPSIMFAQTAIKDVLNSNQPVPVTIDHIISEVARTYNIAPADIKSKKRSANISRSRQVAMYIVKEITQISLVHVGEEFGGRDHSTVVYAIQQVEKKMLKDQRYKEIIEDIIKNIRSA